MCELNTLGFKDIYQQHWAKYCDIDGLLNGTKPEILLSSSITLWNVLFITGVHISK
jgi:hypothetical protein